MDSNLNYSVSSLNLEKKEQINSFKQNFLSKKHKFDKKLCDQILNSQLTPNKGLRQNRKQNLIENKILNRKYKVKSGRWKYEEHKNFIEGILTYGTNWKLIEDHIGTRSAAQARSHAQKFFLKLGKKKFLNFTEGIDEKMSSVTLLKDYAGSLKTNDIFNDFVELLIDNFGDDKDPKIEDLELKHKKINYHEKFNNFLLNENLKTEQDTNIGNKEELSKNIVYEEIISEIKKQSGRASNY